MNPVAVTLVLSSTFMHAGWNLLLRGQEVRDIFILRMLVLVAVLGFIPACLGLMTLNPPFSPLVWQCLLGSGAFCGLYFFTLVRSYDSEDFTVVYPLVRALPVLLVGLGDMLRGRHPTPAGWLGMGLVFLGCAFIPLTSFAGFSLRRYWNRTTPWLLLTALGTVGYSLLDKAASEEVAPGPLSAVLYEYVFFVIAGACYALGMKLNKAEEARIDAGGWKIPALAAAFNFGAYWLVLWAYQLSRHAGYIVAFRQFSIVIGVVLALAIFKEKGRAVRFAGTLLITAGLVVIGLWGG